MGYVSSIDISEFNGEDRGYGIIHNNGFAWNLNFGIIF